MRIDLVGWESHGLRCPDVAIDLRRHGKIPKVALIQMPNGTGKTTTLQLLNATLSGAAIRWDANKVRSYKRKHDAQTEGRFKVTLLVDGRPLSIELTLDYDVGEVRYRTTNPGSGGVLPSWHVPPGVNRFLAPQFLSLFIFDGEFASDLLNAQMAEADKAVDALCQLYLLDDVADFARDYWTKYAKAQTTKTQGGLEKLIEARDRLRSRQTSLAVALKEAKGRIGGLVTEIDATQTRIDEKLGSLETVRARYETSQRQLIEAQGDVVTSSTALMAAMRMPHALHPALGASLTVLRDNLDRLRLPENTSAQFFEELVREEECICGGKMDEKAVATIRERATRYLDADDAGVINALKSDIEQFVDVPVDEEDAGFKRVQRLNKALREAARREKEADQQVRALKQQQIDEGDEQLAAWQARVDQLQGERKKVEDLISDIEGLGDTSQADDRQLVSLSLLAKRLTEAEKRIAEITETVRLRQQAELVQSILAKTASRARTRIKAELVEDCNARLAKVLANDPMWIEEIDRSIRLKDQDGASVGQTLSVGYTFLMSVLSRGNNDFPLVVDSPANPIDLGVRRRLAAIIPNLCSQFVGLTINTERAGFVDTLSEQAPDAVFLTLFRKTAGTQRLMKDLPEGRYVTTDTAVLVDDRDYFYRFDVEDEEDDDHGV
jgi:DNA sulfur modification protein DndD